MAGRDGSRPRRAAASVLGLLLGFAGASCAALPAGREGAETAAPSASPARPSDSTGGALAGPAAPGGLSTRPAGSTAGPRPGPAVPIGGALAYDNDAVWSRLVELAGGAGSRWVVLATASGDPERTAARIVAALERRGARAEALPVAAQWPGVELARAVADPALLARVRAAQGVFLSGGAQERLVDALLPGGRETPLLAELRALQARGGVIAGTSAGAAVMSRQMFRDAGDVFAVLQGNLREGAEIDRGLGFVGADVFVDQHFLRRGRLGRLLPAMVALGFEVGVGVEEDTAAIVQGDSLEVVGARGVLVVDLAQARSDPQLGAFNVQHARLVHLAPGDRFDLRARAVAPGGDRAAARPLDPAAPGFRPYYAHARFFGDVLAAGAVVDAMVRVVDGPAAEVRALAWDPAAPLGFEFTFRRGPGTRAWLGTASGDEVYTIADVWLDVRPVRLASPPYVPLQP